MVGFVYCLNVKLCKICFSRVIVFIKLIKILFVLCFEVLLHSYLTEFWIKEELSSLFKLSHCLGSGLSNWARVLCEEYRVFWKKTVSRYFGRANNNLNLLAVNLILLRRFQQRRRLLNGLSQDFRTKTGFNFDFDLDEGLVCWVKCRLVNFTALWFKYLGCFALLRWHPVEEWASIAVCINLALYYTYGLLSDDLSGSRVGNTNEQVIKCYILTFFFFVKIWILAGFMDKLILGSF